ncbi:hypothetical protein EZV62_019570 [Acer yangbiense]|uniref:Uncharacterized protein n=1 Tax=Acer yangbiense TaxID=1000413 RepID=A0A5C7HBD3_9ROSI|nr:hypothetical protein EZV62_019570 [Acer yangbiense]
MVAYLHAETNSTAVKMKEIWKKATRGGFESYLGFLGAGTLSIWHWLDTEHISILVVLVDLEDALRVVGGDQKGTSVCTSFPRAIASNV